MSKPPDLFAATEDDIRQFRDARSKTLRGSSNTIAKRVGQDYSDDGRPASSPKA